MLNRLYAVPNCLLNYFGEVMKEACDNCDNCLHPKEKFEGKKIFLSLKAILGVQEKFKSEHIATFFRVANSAVKTYNHHHSEFFGAGKEKDLNSGMQYSGKLWLPVYNKRY
jgi:ATP-dependent DNA helicase RecQ